MRAIAFVGGVLIGVSRLAASLSGKNLEQGGRPHPASDGPEMKRGPLLMSVW